MDPVGFSTGGSMSILAGLGIWSGVKTKCQKFVVANSVVETSAGPLVLMDMLTDSNKPVRSWNSKVNSEASSISGISDLENMKDMIVEETNYIDSNALEVDDEIDDATFKKTYTRTYVLDSKPNKISFNNLSDGDDNVLTLLAFKFSGAKHSLAAGLRVLNKCNFGSVKFFTLDVKLLAILEKTNSNKIMSIKKIFYQIDGFEGASTLSKFPGIIRSFFTSELSLKKARELTTHEKIVVNVDVKQINKHLDQVIVVKEIPVNLSKLAVESIADLVTVRWSVVMGKNPVHVVKVIDDKHMWVSRNQHRVLLYILPVGTTVHDLLDLVKSYGEKTCFIGCNPSSYVCDRCAIMCFVDKASKLAAIGSALVFKSINLYWTGLFLVHCAHCKQFGHISTMCSLSKNSGIHDNDFVWNIAMCNVRSINVSAKQENVVHWHRDSGNLVSIIMETKLRSSNRLWIRDKFNEIRVFSFGLDKEFLGAKVAIIMNMSLAHHVCKVSEVPDMAKTIDFLFVSSNLANAVMAHNVFDVEEFFDTDHRAVSVSVKLDGLLNNNFENAMLANTVMFSDEFAVSVKFSDLDVMWDVVRKVMVLLANEVFKKRWFKDFDDVFTKKSSRYHKLELLVSKIVKALYEESAVNFESLIKCWVSLNSVRTSAVQNIVNSGASSSQICSAFCGARKAYHASKLAESCRAKKATIRAAIDKRMKNFKVNKSHTIRSVLEHPFHKVVLDYLVVDNELVLKPNLVKSKYVFDKAFSGVMCSIEFDELFGVVSFLPNGKAAGLLGLMTCKHGLCFLNCNLSLGGSLTTSFRFCDGVPMFTVLTGASSLLVYMNRSLSDLGTASCRAGAAAYFENIGLGLEVDWLHSSLVWHPDLHMAASFTNKLLVNAHTYFIKALHHWLPVLLSSYVSNPFVSTALYKDFVFDDWFCETVSIFCDFKVASLKVVEFVYSLGLAFRADIWSVCAKHCAYMEKNKLIPLDGLTLILVSGLASRFSASVVKLLSIADGFGICFDFHKSSLFFSGLGDPVLVYIAA
ncbi:hypothetical protein G9A89_023297 [Geosiphon pyriformis]|nr:hypothetical protein G9A89_023297 [Geosiphon pyriformis]